MAYLRLCLVYLADCTDMQQPISAGGSQLSQNRPTKLWKKTYCEIVKIF